MTGKSKKDLQQENSKLKEELSDIRLKHESLLQNFETLKKNSETRRKTFKCNKCDNSFESMVDLKAHKDTHGKSGEKFECDMCGKVVNEEWKMCAHRKIHEKFDCTVCGKHFKYLDTKLKHTKIAHENLQIFCHFFNNEKLCPFSKDCIFLHKDAPNCKYGSKCERIYCMFKHEYLENENSEEHSNVEDEKREEHATVEDENLDDIANVEDENTVELISIASSHNPEEIEKSVNDHETTASVTNEAIEVNVIIEAGRDNESIEIENNFDIVNIENDIELSNPPESESVETVKKVKMRKCLMCDFEAATGSDIKIHKQSAHNWCSICFSNFKNHEILKKHTEDNHTVNK